MEGSIRRSSTRLPAFSALFFLGLFAFLSLSSRASASPSLRRRHLHPRQESNSSDSLSPIASSTEFFPGPSSSTFFPSSSVGVVPSSSPVIPSSSPSQPSPSPTSTISTSSVSPSSRSTSSKSTPSQSATLSEASSNSEGSVSSSTITSATSEPSASTTGGFLVTQPSITFLVTDDVALLPTGTTAVMGPGVSTIPVPPQPDETKAPTAVGASKGFWNNKPAVIATFVVVSIVAVGLLALAVFVRRSRARRANLDHDDHFAAPSIVDDQSDRRSSPEASIHEKPLDPFSSRDVVNRNTGYQDPFTDVAYPVSYDATVRPYQEQAGYIPAENPFDAPQASTSLWAPSTSQAAVGAASKQYLLPSQAQAQAAAHYYTPSNNQSSSMSQVAANGAPVRASVDSFYGYKGGR